MNETIPDQKQTLLYRLLGMPQFYRLSQKVFGKNKLYKILLKEYIKQKEGDSILDIGCGTADIVEFLAEKINYVGFDVNPRYINYAKNKFISNKNKIKLYNKRVNEADAKAFEKFDFIISIGVVHHLNDLEAINLFKLGFELLKPGGNIITVDPTVNDADSKIAKFITKRDRGEHVRLANQYKIIANKVFKNVSVIVRKDLLYISQSNCITICKK